MGKWVLQKSLTCSSIPKLITAKFEPKLISKPYPTSLHCITFTQATQKKKVAYAVLLTTQTQDLPSELLFHLDQDFLMRGIKKEVRKTFEL
jgi:hypothetical protein